jgi:hypothetical protein
MVDAVVRECMQLLREETDIEGEELDEMMETLFAIFYVDDSYIASRDPIFLQRTFERVGLETNTKKTQAMTCTPGNIRLQLLTKSTNGCASDTHQLPIGAHSQSPAEDAGKTCRRALSDTTLRINMRSIRCRWWSKSYLMCRRVWFTKSRWVVGSSNA